MTRKQVCMSPAVIVFWAPLTVKVVCMCRSPKIELRGLRANGMMTSTYVTLHSQEWKAVAVYLHRGYNTVSSRALFTFTAYLNYVALALRYAGQMGGHVVYSILFDWTLHLSIRTPERTS